MCLSYREYVMNNILNMKNRLNSNSELDCLDEPDDATAMPATDDNDDFDLNFLNDSENALDRIVDRSRHVRSSPKSLGRGRTQKRSFKVKRRLGRKTNPDKKYDQTPSSALPFERAYRGLRSCKTTDAVEALFEYWWAEFWSKARTGYERRKLPDDSRAKLDAFFLEQPVTSEPILTSYQASKTGFQELYKRLMRAVEEDPEIEMALVTGVCGTGATSHIETEIELAASQQRISSTCRAMSPDFFGKTELVIFNSHRAPNGGRVLQRHEHTLVIGKGVVKRAEQVAKKHSAKFAANITEARTIDVRKVSTDPVNLVRVACYMFKPPYKSLTWKPPHLGKPGYMHGSVKGDRGIRYLRLMQILSMVDFKAMTFAGGLGQSIRSDMLKFLKAEAVNACASGARLMHPDAIASFWADVMRQLSPRFNLPIIMNQK